MKEKKYIERVWVYDKYIPLFERLDRYRFVTRKVHPSDIRDIRRLMCHINKQTKMIENVYDHQSKKFLLVKKHGVRIENLGFKKRKPDRTWLKFLGVY